ncbi:MAG: hypothetical protein Q9208_005467 [Pyrenodesmia sp. 3 TL-2023]
MSSTDSSASSSAPAEEPTGQSSKRKRSQILQELWAPLPVEAPVVNDAPVDKESAVPATPTFTGIPIELRLKVYRLVLVVGGVINSYPSYFQSSQKVEGEQALPQVALLSTCRQVYDEAVSILYGQNTFRLNVTSADLTVSVLLGRNDDLQDAWLGRFWKTQASTIQHVVTAYNLADLHPQHKVEISEKIFNGYRASRGGIWAYPTNSVRVNQQMMSDIETRQGQLQREAWYAKTGLLWEYTNLKSLTLEFQDCYHPSGFSRDETLVTLIKHLVEEYYGERNRKGGQKFSPLNTRAVGLKNIAEELSAVQQEEYGSVSWPEEWSIVDEVIEREDIIAAYDHFITDDRLRTYAEAYPTA